MVLFIILFNMAPTLDSVILWTKPIKCDHSNRNAIDMIEQSIHNGAACFCFLVVVVVVFFFAVVSVCLFVCFSQYS